MSEQVDSLDEMRRQLIRAGARREWGELIALAQRLRAAYPQSPDADYHEGRGLIEIGRYEEADHLLLLGMDRFPRSEMLAVLYGESGTRSIGRDQSIARWQSILVRLPEVPNVYMGLAHAHQTAGALDEADRTIAAGLARLPDNEELLVNRAQLAMHRGDWAAALRAWTHVHQVAPLRRDAPSFMVRALARLGRCPEADTLARAEMAKRPGDIELATSFAMTAAAAGTMTEAAQRWRRVLAIAPTQLWAALGLGRALGSLGRTLDAIAALRDGLKHHPGSEVLLKEVETIVTKAANPDEAVAAWKLLYDDLPPSAATYLAYSEALEAAGKLELAEEIASEGVGFAPDHRALRIRHAALAVANGDPAEALRRWQEADRLFPDTQRIQAGLLRAERAQKREILKVEKEERVDHVKRTSTLVQDAPPSETRIPQVGPTALDLLLATPRAPAAEAPPAETGLRARLRRALGK